MGQATQVTQFWQKKCRAASVASSAGCCHIWGGAQACAAILQFGGGHTAMAEEKMERG